MTGTFTVIVRDEPEASRYVALIDDELVGLVDYHFRGQLQFFDHTEVIGKHEGAGIGTKLVVRALEDVRARGAKMVPACPFFELYVQRHPEYQDLVEEQVMGRIRARRAEQA